MITVADLKIDVTERFERLPNPPIVEAAIDLRSRASTQLEEDALSEILKAKLPGYPEISSQRAVQHAFKLSPSDPPQQTYEDLGWTGAVCRSSDQRQIAQFSRDGFAFHRLQPYDNWDQFSDEAMRLWQIYLDLAKPLEVQRLGLRFINRIVLPLGARLQDVLFAPPKSPESLTLGLFGFLHTTTFVVPGHPFAVQYIQANQPLQPSDNKEFALILDIDAFIAQPFEIKAGIIENYLAQLRWLKNKFFFGSLRPKVIERFK